MRAHDAGHPEAWPHPRKRVVALHHPADDVLTPAPAPVATLATPQWLLLEATSETLRRTALWPRTGVTKRWSLATGGPTPVRTCPAE
jgi:hypothetical protein